MKNVETKKANSNLPLAIIGLVLLAAALGGWWLYSNSKSSPVKSNTNANTGKKTDEAAMKLYASAPAGAQPPNMLGSPNASVIVEEFADFQCPTCATVHGKMKELNSLYGSRIKFVYRNFPLTQIHKNSYDASLAAESAGFQGKYWDMQNQLFTNQKEWSNSAEARKLFEGYAQKIGLDIPRFQNDLVAITTKQRVDSDMQRGRALAITGTPSIFINGKPLAFEQFDVEPMRRIIDAELQKSGGQSAPNQPTTQTPQTQNTNTNSAANTAKDSTGNADKPAEKK
jgi:protein-disulfide isomerase